MTPWQKGFDMPLLRGHAAVFAARHKPLVFGAFGLIKERDIADALAENALLHKSDAAGTPVACAIAKRLRSPGGFTDFAGREIAIPAGHVRCSAFAALDVDSGIAMLRALQRRADGKLWLEIFEEDAVARAAVAQAEGLQYIATRIAAGSEIKGVYSDAPQAWAAPLHDAEQASLVVMRRRFASLGQCAEMLAEIDHYTNIMRKAPWVQHYSSYNLRKSWTAFALRGYDAADPSFIIKPAEMAKSWQQENAARMSARCEWTEAWEHFPKTVACVNRIVHHREVERVRLMRLAPGGELARHADVVNRDAGLADGRLARLHLPIRTSPMVILHGWDKRGEHHALTFPPGALCYLDQRGPHRVENRDKRLERIHLVIDLHSDAKLRDQIAAAMAADARAAAA